MKQGILCDWLGMHLGLFLVCPKLEVRTKTREAVSYLSSPGYVRPAVTEVTVCFPGPVARESGLSSCKPYRQQAGFLGW